jgi:hypothetical protein
MNKEIFTIFVILAAFVTLIQSATIVVEVGSDNKLQFFPNNIKAVTGDSVFTIKTFFFSYTFNLGFITNSFFF